GDPQVGGVPPASQLPGPVGSKTTTAPRARPAVVPVPPAPPRAAVVRAVARADGPEFSPSFASDGTALFFHTGRSADARSALVSAGSLDGDLRVMTLVDD